MENSEESKLAPRARYNVHICKSFNDEVIDYVEEFEFSKNGEAQTGY